jgi:O-methyltransferase
VEILRRLKRLGQRALARRGIVAEVHRAGTPEAFTYAKASGRHYPVDFSSEVIETMERVSGFTLTSSERVAAVCAATEYVARSGLSGCFVECGVWRGGSMMAAALTLRRLHVEDRDFYLFDTYEGATRPSEADVTWTGHALIQDDWIENDRADAISQPDVHAALVSTGYEPARLHYIAGDVRETLPEHAPKTIALLRLDTDYYDSTLHELVHLYPHLVSGGVLIIDDYGHYRGARQAVDEYFADDPVFLSRIDYSGRLVIKP